MPEMIQDHDFEALLEYLNRTRGFDFSGYKRSSLERRFAKRMDEVGISSSRAYIDRLEVDPDEFAQLFDTILINVTGFFRDRPAWEYLAEDALPRILEGKDPDEAVRVWCAGCATGEEAYTTAMVLAETLGEDEFRERVKIYGTDVDVDALGVARQAVYGADQVKDIRADLRERYFERTGARYTFRPELRRQIIFGRNDLVQDAPISRVDLIVCRNTLMYFNAETQSHMLERFHFALRDAGVLFLGKSEMLITQSDLFVPLELKRRVFSKVERPTGRDRYAFVATAGNGSVDDGERAAGPVRESALDATPVAQIVVDAERQLVFANQRARLLFGLSRRDSGRSLQDLDVSYKPVELRPGIDRAHDTRRPVSLGQVEHANSGRDRRTLDVVVTPVVQGADVIGSSITFDDVTGQVTLREDLERSKNDLETAYEELQSTVEELETTNEELQSTNEELETTNEELQSTNEELETMNEELQSTNEELETTNDELRLRGGELDRVNNFLDTILVSLGLAVVVLDEEQMVRVWNSSAEELWGLRADEVLGTHFLGLDIGLPIEDIKQHVLTCLSGSSEGEEVTVDALNRRGRKIRCRVACVPLARVSGADVSGAILMMEALPES